MRRMFVVVVVGLIGLASCSDDPLGLLHGIVAGNHQTIVAGTTELPDGVTWRLVRSKNGTITGHWADPFLPKYAHAQGSVTVTGSPVPGAVVCVEDIPELEPFVRCTNTDANGEATFFIDVNTTQAGTYRAEIRGTLNNQPAVFDTIAATVAPASADTLFWFGPVRANGSPATHSASAVSDEYGNVIPYRIVGDERLTVAGDTVGTVAARRVTYGATPDTTAWFTTQLRGANNAHVGNLSYRIIAGVGGAIAIEWHAYGRSQTRLGTVPNP